MLSKVSVDPELSSLLDAMAQQDHRHQRVYGQNVPHAVVASLLPDRGTAVVRDCQDSSHSGVTDIATGRPVTVGSDHNPLLATMHLDPDGVWRVAFITYKGVPAC